MYNLFDKNAFLYVLHLLETSSILLYLRSRPILPSSPANLGFLSMEPDGEERTQIGPKLTVHVSTEFASLEGIPPQEDPGQYYLARHSLPLFSACLISTLVSIHHIDLQIPRT